jgi:hypothetical protein
VRLADGAETTGRLTAVDDDGIDVGGRRLPWAEVGRGRVEIEFARLDELADDGDVVDDADDDGEAGS